MANINEILQRAASLRDETALNSISPERAGGIMYDTLIALNELWLQQGSALVISKIYASVSAMEADTAPVSDLTGQPLRPGQIVVIASSDSDNGSVYRYNGTTSPSWTSVGKIGNLEPVDSLDSDSTSLPLAAHQGKVLDGKISQLGQEVDDLQDDLEEVAGSKTVLTPTIENSAYVDSSGTIITGDSSWKLFKYDIGNAERIRVTAGSPAAQYTPYCAFYSDSGFSQVVGTPIETRTLAGETTDIDVPTGAHYFAGSIVFNMTVDVATLTLGEIGDIQKQVNSVLNVTQLRGYYECPSAASSPTKVITGDYTQLASLTTGSHFLLKMTNAHSATYAEINVNSLGAKRLWYNGAPSTAYNTWEAGEMLDVYFDGTNFQAVNFNNSLLVERASARNTILDESGFIDESGEYIQNPAYNHTRMLPYFSGNKYRIKGYEALSAPACLCFNANKEVLGRLTLPTGQVEFILDDNNVIANTAYFVVNGYVAYPGYVEALSTYDVLRELYRFDESLDARIQREAKLLVAAGTWELDAIAREKALRQEFINSGQPEKWYGVEWQEDSDPDNVSPINSPGDENLHTTLPIQNKMRRCVVKNGFVKYYLDADNSELKADGTAAKLDGTDGDVMVEIPEFFFKCEKEIVGGVKTVRLKISEQGIPGFKYSRMVYTSAYEATINRSTNILASVCTTIFTRATEEVKSESGDSYIVGNVYSYGMQKTAIRNGFSANASNFRGGTNDSTLDTETNPTSQNYSRNQLGIPVSNINRKDAREHSDKYHNIFINQYDTQKKLWILAQVEFKTRNIQKPISDGGMGMGATVYPDYNAYEAFFQPQRGIACLPCGITNSLGNHTGEVYFKMINVPVQSTGTGAEIVYNRFADVWMPVMSYRGVENFYGHIYDIVDGINARVTDTGTYVVGHNGDPMWKIYTHTYFYEPNPFLTTNSENPDNLLGTYTFPSNVMSVSQLMLGEDAHILHTGANGKDMNENYCDASELLANTRLEFITFNGRIVSGNLVGFHFIVSADAADGHTTRPSDGTRINMF